MSFPRAPLLMVASSSRTGPVEGFIALARELRAQGIDARFAGDTVRPGENLGAHLAEAGVPWEDALRLSRKVRVRDVVHDLRELRARLRASRHDLLHCGFAHDQTLALGAARGLREMRVVRAAQRAADLAAGVARGALLRACDGVVVHAASYRERALRLGVRPERVEVVHAGIDAERFSPGRAEALRAEWGVPAGAPLAGIVARMKPERNHRKLLEAWAQVRVPGAWLVLVGRGEEEAALRAQAAALPRVVFGGYRRGHELVQAYRALDVAVWLREGNDGACRGVLEAMACGVPVIAGSEGAPPELVGETGVVVDAFDAKQIAGALEALLGDPAAARAARGVAARERASLFTQRRAADQVLAFWRRLRELPRA